MGVKIERRAENPPRTLLSDESPFPLRGQDADGEQRLGAEVPHDGVFVI